MRSEDFYKNDPMKESGMETYQKLGVGMLVHVFGWPQAIDFYRRIGIDY